MSGEYKGEDPTGHFWNIAFIPPPLTRYFANATALI